MKLRTIVCIAGILSASPISAATLQVPSAYPSIQAAINAAQPGDTVSVAAGVYSETITMKDRVDLVGQGAGLTVLRGSGYLDAASDALIQGFTLDGLAIRCLNKSPLIRGNVIKNTSGYGISISGNAWPTIFQNHIYNNAGGIYSNGLATIVNNTIVDNVKGYGISGVSKDYPALNNLVVGHDLGLVNYSYSSGYQYLGGYNNVYGSRRDNFWRLTLNPGDVSQPPRFVRAPLAGMHAYKVEQTPSGPDVLYVQYDWTGRVQLGDHIEIDYDDLVRTVTSVEYGQFGNTYWSTRIQFTPPLGPNPPSSPAVLNWGAETDLSYDFGYQPDSVCLDGGSPDPQWNDADGTVNDIGAVGGTMIAPTYEMDPPAAVANLQAVPGDTEVVLSWSRPLDVDLSGYLILRQESEPVAVHPESGVRYGVFAVERRDTTVGNSVVTYSGTDPLTNTFTDQELMPGVDYHYAVFATDRFLNYSAAAPASASPFHEPVTLSVALDGSGDFLTIGEAMAAARPSDTVILRPGEYGESFDMKNGVHLVGDPAGGVVLHPDPAQYFVARCQGCAYGSIENLSMVNDTTNPNVSGIYQEYASSLDVRDVHFSGFATGLWYRGVTTGRYTYYEPPRMGTVAQSVFEGTGTAVSIRDGLSPIIHDNRFLNNTGSGIYMQGYCDPMIQDNEFSGNGHGIYVWDDSKPLIQTNSIVGNTTGIGHAWRSHSTITQNVIAGNASNGIYAVSYSSPLVTNNLITGNGADGLWMFLNWPRVYNNTVIENAENGMTVEYHAGVDTRNNIFAFNGGWGVAAGEDYYRGYPRLSYNIVHGNALGDASPWTALLVGNLFDDPMFRSRTQEDYQLLTGSPAIDAGDPDPAFDDPDGTRNDMGAYGGPDALPPGAVPIDEQIAAIESTIITFPSNAFKNELDQRKIALENKLEAVLEQIEAAKAAPDVQTELAHLTAARDQLVDDLLAKTDGHFGGRPNNDWILTYEAQSVVYPLLVDLINEVEMLIQALD